jgi:hypothetical protein
VDVIFHQIVYINYTIAIKFLIHTYGLIFTASTCIYHDFAKIYGPPQILQKYTSAAVAHGVRGLTPGGSVALS